MKAVKTGAWITLTVLILNWILSLANVSVKQIFGITATTGITTTIGNKVVSILQNLVTFESIVYLFISATLIIYVGAFIKDKVKMLPSGKTEWSRLALTLLYGTVPFYLLLVGFKLPGMGTLVGLAVYYAAVALSFGLVKQLKIKLI